MWDVIRKLWHDGYPVIGTLFMMQASRAVTYETTLAFFGLGDPILKTWGRLIRISFTTISGAGICSRQ